MPLGRSVKRARQDSNLHSQGCSLPAGQFATRAQGNRLSRNCESFGHPGRPLVFLDEFACWGALRLPILMSVEETAVGRASVCRG